MGQKVTSCRGGDGLKPKMVTMNREKWREIIVVTLEISVDLFLELSSELEQWMDLRKTMVDTNL